MINEFRNTKSNLKYLIVLSLFFFFCIGCLKTRNEVKETEQKQVIQQTVVSLQKNNADTSSRLSDFQDQLRDYNGRIEVLENRVSKLNPDQEKNLKSVIESQVELQKKITALQEEMVKQEAINQQIAAEIQKIKSEKILIAEKPAEASKKSLFAQAEDLFKQSEWKKAIIQYQKYRDENPKGKSFAESTYKIGVCFQELGLKDEAKTFYEEVVSKFPNSPEAKKAKTRLKKTKK